jgi:hypothetical protein
LNLLSAAVAADVGAYHAPHDSATDSGGIPAASAADLVTENAADDGADNRSGDVGVASFLRDLFTLDPASLLGRADHRAD